MWSGVGWRRVSCWSHRGALGAIGDGGGGHVLPAGTSFSYVLLIRVSRQGDTCIDNRGPNAPYITVTSQLEGGLYRVQPGQHVSFQHGSLREVVDTEHEPCGCPAPVAVAVASAPVAATPATPSDHSGPGHPVGGPSSTPADTTFPLAVSEGLTQTPLPPTTPVASPGEVHAQVAVPFRYSGNLPAVSDTTGAPVQPQPPPRHTAALSRSAGACAIEPAHSAARRLRPGPDPYPSSRNLPSQLSSWQQCPHSDKTCPRTASSTVSDTSSLASSALSNRVRSNRGAEQ